MSASLTCDNCGSTLILNKRNEAENGEDSAWLVITTRGFETKWDACTLSCATELIDHGGVREVVEHELQIISDIVNTIRDEQQRRDEEDES